MRQLKWAQALALCPEQLAVHRYLWALLPVVLGFNLACLQLRLVSTQKDQQACGR